MTNSKSPNSILSVTVYTVTRIDVIFRYPDQVPLTHFTHTVEQKKFLAGEPEFSVDFSAPPEFSHGVMEKCLSTG
jgi:hypothetical protein